MTEEQSRVTSRRKQPAKHTSPAPQSTNTHSFSVLNGNTRLRQLPLVMLQLIKYFPDYTEHQLKLHKEIIETFDISKAKYNVSQRASTFHSSNIWGLGWSFPRTYCGKRPITLQLVRSNQQPASPKSPISPSEAKDKLSCLPHFTKSSIWWTHSVKTQATMYHAFYIAIPGGIRRRIKITFIARAHRKAGQEIQAGDWYGKMDFLLSHKTAEEKILYAHLQDDHINPHENWRVA